ncbi:helix-turn-helix domain-containing protein [Pseudonocardia alni]|uniref:helix-turn-helix domain-containing protein n=1 Tax=Pseudonocardia alni TaxID=33907 RepID=UPI00280B4213|nr:XRE family transcriptional regulator [Pseudonocardia alni]
MPSTSDRVRDLIKASGLTQHEFGQQVGLDDSKLSKALGGSRRFSSLDLARIADLSKVTVDWLITGDEPPLALAARTTGGSASTALHEARRLSTMRSDLADLGFPQAWRPPVVDLGSGGWVDQGARLAEAALMQADRFDGQLEPGDLPHLVETVFGADVAIRDLGGGFDGLAISSDQVKLIVLAASQVPARQRFTLAHELGHLLAGDDQGFHLDEDVFDKTQSKMPSELRANSFAASFLMPEAALRAAVGTAGLTESSFATLACDLIVTPSTLAYRLKALRLIDAGTCDRFRTLTGRMAASMAGRGPEFAQRVTEASRPRPPGLLARDAYTAHDAGATTLRPYANLLGVDVDNLSRALDRENGAFYAS